MAWCSRYDVIRHNVLFFGVQNNFCYTDKDYSRIEGGRRIFDEMLRNMLLIFPSKHERPYLQELVPTVVSLVVRKLVFRVSTRSDTNRAVRLHKVARDLKLCIYEVEGLCYQCRENKGADQLRGCKKPVFS